MQSELRDTYLQVLSEFVCDQYSIVPDCRAPIAVNVGTASLAQVKIKLSRV